jgi:hypothetical protein
MVSPGFGRVSHLTTMSMFRLPTTAMRGFTGFTSLHDPWELVPAPHPL